MKITAYVPCHNGEATLPEVLQALKAQTRPADQHLLINDRSTDRTVAIAEQYGFEVKHTGPDHFGMAASRNMALQFAQGDILVGVDANVVAEPSFLAEVEKQLTTRPEISGLCGCLQEKFTDTIADLWRAIHLPQHYGEAEVVNPMVLHGSTSAHRVEALRKMGGWDMRFRTNFEDADLTERMRKAGLNFLYTSACRLWHLRRDTPATVLKTYWAWHTPAAEIMGNLNSLATWVSQRLSHIWRLYGAQRLRDRAAPKIAILTCQLPWTMILRDLHRMASREGRPAHLHPLAPRARNLLLQLGADPVVANYVQQELETLVADLPAGPGQVAELDPRLFQAIEEAALAHIPDINYWSNVESFLH
jgi:GT2 family glycosyltransferase